MKSNVNRELAEIQRQFRAFYDEKLKGQYEELEEKRKPYLKRFCWRAVLLIVFVAGSYYFGILNYMVEKDNDVAGTIWGFALLLLCAYWWQPVENYKQDTKMLAMNKILSFWGNLTYRTCPGEVHSQTVLKQSMLFDAFNRREYDDCFEGSYNGVKIAVSEQELRDVHGSGKNKRDVQIFKGILISLEMNKQFDGQTVVHAKKWGLISVLAAILIFFLVLGGAVFADVMDKIDAMMFAMFFPLAAFLLCGGFWVVKNWFGKKRVKMQQVKLEDVVFDKNWNVKATDQIEARYVLTPAFMERILEVKRRFKGKKIEFSFWKNKVLIAVHTNKDMFETTSLFTSALNYRKMQEVVAQFYSVFSVADVLLNTNKKQGL
ncbi:MAG: DUF3137 domain-containing protein [Alphaproteobacteria bacterium]|nr:DUF3137 domain-containing protein [Alphaproteobacteria bacterium]